MIIILLLLFDGRKGAGQNAVHLRDSRSIIRDRNAVCAARGQSGAHLLRVEHTSAAVDHERKVSRIVREFPAGREAEAQLFAGVGLQPARKLFRADVAALPVVRAALGDQDGVAVLQAL